MSAHVRRATGVAVLSLATALAQTAPLALHLGSAIPFGTYPAPVVPRLNLWALWWNSERLLHGYRGYWQAPIFHPDPFAFAYTEPQWLSGLVAGALWWTTARPALAYDAVVLIAFTLNGCCGYFLLRRLRIGFWPALCGGLVIEMLPFVADQIGVLQSTVLFPIPMTLACLVGFGRTGSAWSALGGVLWMAVCYHTSANTALFFGPAALLALLVFGGRRLLDARSALVLAVVGLVGALLVVPTAVVQERVLAKVQPDRPESMVRATSARPEAYLQMPATNLLRRRPPDRRAYALYPGTGLILLALVGSWHGLRHRGLRRWTLYGLAVVLAFVLLSFGPLLAEASFGSPLGALYAVLRAAYPGFRLARNLWRFGGLAQVFLATLAGFGLAACFGPEPHRPRRALLGGALTVALGLELFSAPIPLLDLGRKPTELEWVRWLRDSPPGTTIIHLPMAAGVMPDDFERTTFWMYCQMYHGRRMANGYSAYIPGNTVLLKHVMPGFPDAESIRTLRYFGINHVLVAADWATPERAEQLERWKAIVVPELATSEMTIYAVGAGP